MPSTKRQSAAPATASAPGRRGASPKSARPAALSQQASQQAAALAPANDGLAPGQLAQGAAGAPRAGQAFSWAESFPARLLETPRQASARLWLNGSPAWPLVRASLKEAMRLLDAPALAMAKAQAMAHGLWSAARADLSWVAEAFVAGDTGQQSKEIFSCERPAERVLAFERLGFPWLDLAPRALALAAQGVDEMGPGSSDSRPSPDGGFFSSDGGAQWTRLCAQALLFPLAVPPESAQQLAIASLLQKRPQDPAEARRLEDLQALCAGAVFRFCDSSWRPEDTLGDLARFAAAAVSRRHKVSPDTDKATAERLKAAIARAAERSAATIELLEIAAAARLGAASAANAHALADHQRSARRL